MITLVVPADELGGESLEVAGEAYRHLFRSRRLARDQELRLVDGVGRARWARVDTIGPKVASLALGASAPAHDPPRRVRLLVAAPRFQRASWLVEKASEIGIAEIHFLQTERSPREYGIGNLQRLRRVAIAAVEQSQGAWLPEISAGRSFEEIPDLIAGCEVRKYLDPGPRRWRLESRFPGGPAAAIVGPEGGWSPQERQQMEAWELSPWSLGERILRVETAALVASAWLVGLAEE